MFIRKQYLRDDKRNKIGVMVAIEKDNEISFGFSKCNVTRDKFDKNIGTQIAIGRADKYKDTSAAVVRQTIPDSVYPDVIEFIERTIERHPTCIFPAWISFL